jgi:hypothetical protein
MKYKYIIKKIVKIIDFLDFFPAIAQTLDHFTKLPKHTYTRPGAADVNSLLYSICNFDFVVACYCYWYFPPISGALPTGSNLWK